MNDDTESFFDEEIVDEQENIGINEDEDSEIEDILSDLSADDDDDDQESEGESGDDDGSEESESQSTKKAKKPSRWKRKISYLTQEKEAAKREVEEAKRDAERARREADDSRKFIQSIFGTVTGDVNQPVAADVAAGQPAKKQYSEDDINKLVSEQVRQQLGGAIKKQSEISKLGSKWSPQVERIKKELGKNPQKVREFVDWFGSYTKDVDSNTEKKLLLGVAGNLEYAAETLYTIDKSSQFRGLSLDDKIGAMYKLHADISEKRKKQTGSSKSVASTKQAGSVVPKKYKTIMDMPDEEFYKLRTGRR